MGVTAATRLTPGRKNTDSGNNICDPLCESSTKVTIYFRKKKKGVLTLYSQFI